VLGTLGAPQRRLLRGRRGRALTDAEPEPVPTVRATVVRTAAFGSLEEAQGWLAAVRRDEDARQLELDDALRRINAAVRAQRAAAGDPYAREVSTAQALVVRLG